MENTEVSAPEAALKGLLEKYSVADAHSFSLNEELAFEDGLHLLPGWNWISCDLSKQQVPLLTWRVRPSVAELKKIVEDKIVENVCLIRCGCMACKDGWSLDGLIYRQMDLCEYISASEITSVYSVMNPGRSVNIIARLKSDVLCSIEITMQLPEGTGLQEKFELIGQRGAASNMVVDTQVSQRSVYTFTNNGARSYQDMDMELFGLEESAIEQVRAAFEVLAKPELKAEWIQQHAHIDQLILAVHASARQEKKINIS